MRKVFEAVAELMFLVVFIGFLLLCLLCFGAPLRRSL